MSLTPVLVALCERPVPDPGPGPMPQELTDDDYNDIAVELLRQYECEPLWIFAYGSLLWKPACEIAETTRATALGWHRDFCLELRSWRGSPERPGLMMGLRRRGFCEGMAMRLPDTNRHGQLVHLLRREVGEFGDLTSIQRIPARTNDGMVNALTFWAESDQCTRFETLDISKAAHILARACGHIGSGAAYLYQTVASLEELGIRDDYLWRLQQLVAARNSTGRNVSGTMTFRLLKRASQPSGCFPGVQAIQGRLLTVDGNSASGPELPNGP